MAQTTFAKMHRRQGTTCGFLASFIAAVICMSGCTRDRPEDALDPNAYLGPPVAIAIDAEGPAEKIVTELTKYARFFGCPVVAGDAGPAYVLSGTIRVSEGEHVTDGEKVILYQWQVDASLELTETATRKVVETFVLDGDRRGKPENDAARKATVEAGALFLAQVVLYDGQVLGQPDVRNLIADLVIQSTEGLLYNDIVNKLVAAGQRAVPYLLWRLDDRRTVELAGDLPGLTDETAGKVRVYHVANHTLERIFDLKTNLTVHSPREFLRRVKRGWRLEWLRRCPAYRRGEQLEKALRERPWKKPVASDQ